MSGSACRESVDCTCACVSSGLQARSQSCSCLWSASALGRHAVKAASCYIFRNVACRDRHVCFEILPVGLPDRAMAQAGAGKRKNRKDAWSKKHGKKKTKTLEPI